MPREVFVAKPLMLSLMFMRVYNEIDVVKVLAILTQLNHHGIRAYVSNDSQLVLRYPKGTQLENAILSELKLFKSDLLRYLKAVEHEYDDHDEPLPEHYWIEHDGQYYYPITSTQHYWINEDIDRQYKETDSIHGAGFISGEISGRLNVEHLLVGFKKILERHESLRSIFHRIGNEYYMQVKDLGSLSLYEYMEVLEENVCRRTSEELDHWLCFNNHRFDHCDTRLFLVRALRATESKIRVSIKIHHVIFDGWSREVLIRDLVFAVSSSMNGHASELPPLPFQYKESLARLIRFKARYYDAHRNYWKGLFQTLPEPIVFQQGRPGDRDMATRLCRKLNGQFSPEDAGKLTSVARSQLLSVFVVLQATFKNFVCARFGKTDIAIGTYVFGRDLSGSEDLIGCFADTVLIRTQINPSDTFAIVLQKVKKSNEDMRHYRACGLMEVCRELLSEAGVKNDGGPFWNINLQFEDINKKTYLNQVRRIEDGLKSSGIEFVRSPGKVNSHLSIDLQVQYNFYDERTITIDMEYDSSLYNAREVQEVLDNYLSYTHEVLSTFGS